MCTLVMLRRPDHDWPMVIGANRDEMRDRAWRRPDRHWPDRPEIVAGYDEVAGGSWLGINAHGLVAAVLNRVGTLGALKGKRSRGELVLEALDHADAVEAATALAQLETRSYRPFNLLLADSRDAFWLAHRGGDRIEVAPIPEGISMLTARELNDPTSPRIAHHAGRFLAAPPPAPAADDWFAWEALLGDTRPQAGFGPESAMSFMTPAGFGTSSISLIALPSPALGRPPEWRFAGVSDGLPAWERIALDTLWSPGSAAI